MKEFLSAKYLDSVGVPNSLQETTKVRKLDKNTYAADLSVSFCVGTGKQKQAAGRAVE